VPEVLRPQRTEDKDIVKKHKYKLFKKGSQDVVHHRLEGRRRVHEAERHHKEFEQSLMGAEGALVDVVSGHLHLVITGLQV
jgi:K+/H+ antiporter YhaU regulatory subunit KhtT